MTFGKKYDKVKAVNVGKKIKVDAKAGVKAEKVSGLKKYKVKLKK